MQKEQVIDLEVAIDHGENALVHIPLDHPDLADLLINLADTFVLRYNLSNSLSNGRRAHSMYLGAWNCLQAPPLKRINAARRAVQLFPSLNSWDKASSMLEDAVQLMTKMSLARSLERDDQQKVLGDLYGLSTLAVAAALEAGKGTVHALSLLELGRGILSGHISDTRSDVMELKLTHPKLLEDFLILQMEINAPLEKTSDTEIAFARRKDAMGQFNRILADIHAIHQYRGFLLPSIAESMCKTAEGGTIVVVNCTEIRSDAIIVTRSAITSIPLPKLIHKEMKSQMSQLPGLLKRLVRTFASRNKTLCEILRWLWNVAVEEVLKSLRLKVLPARSKRKNTTSPPRIWWIGTGEMSIASFHATGIYKPGCTRNTLSRVCSSYIPTIKALAYARQSKFTLRSKDAAGTPKHKILLATMRTTPNHAPLPSVELEASSVHKIVGQKLELTILSQPKASEVLETLPDYDVVHFTCHGMSDRKNRPKSSLILIDSSDSDNPVANYLTIQAISDAHIERAQLAYLSACSTADNTATNLDDETVHLVSAFQLAGFTHVVANLWQSKDDACMQVAADFYSALLNSEMEEGDVAHEKVSLALHGAVARLREEMPMSSLVWAPLIHTGA